MSSNNDCNLRSQAGTSDYFIFRQWPGRTYPSNVRNLECMTCDGNIKQGGYYLLYVKKCGCKPVNIHMKIDR